MSENRPQFPIPAIFCHDNLDVLRGMNSATVDLVYLDPPFNKGKQFHAPVGSKAEGASFSDIWHEDTVKAHQHLELADSHPDLYRYIDAIENIGSRSAKWYLVFMAARLIEIRRILKPTGSIYLHCDPTANYLIRGLMDAIFGYQNFRNEIIWAYKRMPSKAKKFQQVHDTVLFYSKQADAKFNVLFTEPDPDSIRTFKSARNRGYNVNLKKKMVTVFDWNKYEKAVQQGTIPDDLQPTEFKGGRPPMRDWWNDIKILGGPRNKERVDYPTQKPLKLLERIIQASSDPGDLVLDPFCGCATTCVAAHLNDRRWIGIDVSPKAYELVKVRLEQQTAQGRLEQGMIPTIAYYETPFQRTDMGDIKPLTGKWKTEVKQRLYGIQGGNCAARCGVLFNKQNLQIDHKIAISKGGTDHPDNLQLLCGNCNSIKGNRPMEYLEKRIQRSRRSGL